MPSMYTQYLKRPINAPLNHDDLHDAILELAISYHTNFELIFPGLPYLSLLVQSAKLMALPGLFPPPCKPTHEARLTIISVEVILAARSIIAALDCTFRFPVKKQKIYPIDHPDILLVSTLLVATKVCFPLGSSMLVEGWEAGMPRLDWQEWSASMSRRASNSEPSAPELDLKSVTAEQVVLMTESELDDYFRRISSLNDKQSALIIRVFICAYSLTIDELDTNPLSQFFPLQAPLLPDVPVVGTKEDDIEASIYDVIQASVWPREREVDQSASKSDEIYAGYQTMEDLSPTARKLYEAAGSYYISTLILESSDTSLAYMAGLQLSTLVRAVYMLEQRIIIWQRQHERSVA